MTIPVPQGDLDGQYVYGVDENGALLKKPVGIEEIDYFGRFGARTYSGTSATIGIGLHYFVLDIDDPNFRVGDDVLIVSNIEKICFMWGEIVGTDTVATPKRILVYVDDISDAIGTYASWTLQVVARPKPGIEKDTSTSSVDPTGAGPFTFPVTAGKFWPLGGTLLIKPTADRTIALLGKVKAYSGTSLVVEKTFTNATVSTSYTSWAIALLDAPTTALTLVEREGLTIEAAATNFIVRKGRIRDSTDTLDLVLPDDLTRSLSTSFTTGDTTGSHVKVQGDGTVSFSSGTITGSGSNLATLFGDATDTGFYDYGTTLFTHGNTSGDFAPTISTFGTGQAGQVTSTSSETDGVGSTGLTGSGLTYYRGGYGVLSLTRQYYGVVLIRRDVDGEIRVCLSSATPSKTPDLPSGYTYYRVVGVISLSAGQIYEIFQNTSLPGLSVWGNPGLDVDLPEAITATNGSAAVLRESSGALGFGTVATAGIANDAISNAKLANMAAYTLKGRNAGTAGDPSDIDIPALTEKTTLVDADLFLIADSAASNAFKKVQKSNVSTSPFSSGNLFIAASL